MSTLRELIILPARCIGGSTPIDEEAQVTFLNALILEADAEFINYAGASFRVANAAANFSFVVKTASVVENVA